MAGLYRKHVLQGVKVIDFTQFLAGPTVTRLMAEMGAEVIKVELAPNGDPSHALPYMRGQRSAYYIQQNRGKKSLCVDLKTEEGREIVRGLIPKMDVLVENFAPGVIGRLGFDYPTVRQLNPGIVMCSISAFGQTGPLSREPGFDYIGQAYAAVTYMIGEADGSPYFPMLGLGDVSTGAHAALGIVSALLDRQQTGKGQYLDVSLLDVYFHFHEMNVQVYSASGGTIKPKRSGAHHPQIGPCGVFKGHQNYLIIIAFVDHQFQRLCEVMGKPELVSDPRFATGQASAQNAEKFAEFVNEWLASTPSDEAAIAALREARIPVAPVLSIEQAVNHPHLRERGTVRKLEDRIFGEFEAPGFPLRFSGYPHNIPLEAPTLGGNNREILRDYLNYDEERITELFRRGILHQAER